MTLKELKENILDHNIPENFIIFQNGENSFISNQYVSAMSSISGQEINKINSIFEPVRSSLSLVIDFNNYINVVETDIFDEYSDDYSQFKHTIVICNKIDENIIDKVTDYVIKIPKLLDWQVKDYIKAKCSGLSELQCINLYNLSHGDIYKINNELDKLNAVDITLQEKVFNALLTEPGTDLYTEDPFLFVNSIMKLDTKNVIEHMLHEYLFNTEPTKLIANLLTQFKNYIFILTDCNFPPEAFGLEPKRVYGIKKGLENVNFSVTKLTKIIDFLSGINLRLCNGDIDIDNNKFIDYIVCKIYNIVFLTR